MKKVVLTVALAIAASFAFAQEKSVKEAKRIANGTNPDFAQADQLIQGAMVNPETKDMAETWNVAGIIERRKGEKEQEKGYLRQPFDTLLLYNSVLNMYKYFYKCDELAQLPDEKGKVKNKYRKNNASVMKTERGNLLNGGVEYFNRATNRSGDEAKECNAKALEFFGTYIDMANHPMFEADNFLQTDTMLPTVAYYACLAATKNEDHANVLKYAPYAKPDKEMGKFALEMTCTSLKAMGDTVKWVSTLQEGVKNYPDHSFFFGSLIDYYSNNNKYDEAMQFADNMLSQDPNNDFYLYVKGYLFHNMSQYDNAIEYYTKATEANPNNAEAFSNMGLIYCIQAQEFSQKATADINSPQYQTDQATLKAFYEKAKPCYEKARALKPEQKDLWISGLYRVYYNLDMGPEFKEIEDLMQ